jgi:hypothetical protein
MLLDLYLWLDLLLSHLLTTKAVIAFTFLLVAFTLIGMAWSVWGPSRRPK